MREWPEWWKDEWALFKVEKDDTKRRKQWDAWPQELKTCAIRAAGGWRRDELILWQRQDLETATRANAAVSRARRAQEAASSPPPPVHQPEPPLQPPPAALEPTSHSWTEGSRIGEASNPGPKKDDIAPAAFQVCPAEQPVQRQQHSTVQGAGTIHRSIQFWPRPGRRAGTTRGRLPVKARGCGYNRSGRSPTALRTRPCPEHRQGRPSQCPLSCGGPYPLPAVRSFRTPPVHDLARDGDVHPNPGPRRQPSATSPRRRRPPSQQLHQHPFGSHVPARSSKPAQVPTGQRDAWAAPHVAAGERAKGNCPGPKPPDDHAGNRPGGNGGRKTNPAAMINLNMSRVETVQHTPGKPQRGQSQATAKVPTLEELLGKVQEQLLFIQAEVSRLKQPPAPNPPKPPPGPDLNPWSVLTPKKRRRGRRGRPPSYAEAIQLPSPSLHPTSQHPQAAGLHMPQRNSSIGFSPPSRSKTDRAGGGGGAGGRAVRHGGASSPQQQPGQQQRGRYAPRSGHGPACLPGGGSQQGQAPRVPASQPSRQPWSRFPCLGSCK